MSSTIDSIHIVASNGFRLKESIYQAWYFRRDELDLPANHFLTTRWLNNQKIDQIYIYPKTIWWSDDGSGSTKALLEKLLTSFEGSADLILIWDGGDSVSGLRVTNGKVTEHEVGYTLLPNSK